jgi:excinuclease UvrABC nuclease subunit
MREGSLDGIGGLGDGRRKRLLKELGGMPGVKSASLDQLRALSWLPESVAIAVFEHLRR